MTKSFQLAIRVEIPLAAAKGMKRDLHLVGDSKIGVCMFGAFSRAKLADGNGRMEMPPERQSFDGFPIAFVKDDGGGVSNVIDARDLNPRCDRRAVRKGECDFGGVEKERRRAVGVKCWAERC